MPFQPSQFTSTSFVCPTVDGSVSGQIVPGYGADPFGFAGVVSWSLTIDGPITESSYVPSFNLCPTCGSNMTAFADTVDLQVSSRVRGGRTLRAHSQCGGDVHPPHAHFAAGRPR